MPDDLAVCPCGDVPEKLCVEATGAGDRWSIVNGYCCGVWGVAFRTDYEPHGSEEIMRRAREAWNAAPRGNK